MREEIRRVRTCVYPLEICLLEVIEDANVTAEYAELLEEVTRPGKKSLVCSPTTSSVNDVMTCPVCGTDCLWIIAAAIVTDRECILTTEDGTKIIRSKELDGAAPGARIIAFAECKNHHMTKLIWQNIFVHLSLLIDNIKSQKVRKLVDGRLTLEDMWITHKLNQNERGG